MIETILTLSGVGMPAMSAQNCEQTLEMLPLGGLRRTVNGKLVYTGNKRFQKYKSTLRGRGKYPLGFEGLFRGQQVTVGCIQRLWQRVEDSPCDLGRPYVERSLLVVDENFKSIPFEVLERGQIKIPNFESFGKLYLSYCPHLEMHIVDFNQQAEEWGGEVKWEMNLEEV